MTKDTGGPAFPAEGGVDSGLHANPGMDLRDWFAGKALAGLLASEQVAAIKEGAEEAYKIADAMIAARSKP